MRFTKSSLGCTYYYYTQVHSGDLFWNLDVFLKKLTVVFSLWSKQYITGLNGTFFQIFFSPTVWETKNLDAKLRTNDWPGGQKCSSTRSPRTGFSRCFFYLFYSKECSLCFVPEISMSTISLFKEKKTQKNILHVQYKNVCDIIINSVLYKICRKCIIYYYTYSQTTWIYILV